MERVFVSGIGVVSALGANVNTTLNALQKGRSGLSALELFPTKYAETLRFGEVKLSDEILKEELSINLKTVNRTSLLALKAMKEALEMSGLNAAQLKSYDTALITANTVGGMCATDQLYQDANFFTQGSDFINDYDNGSVTLFLQSYYGIKGVCNTINTACSSGINAIQFGARLIQLGLAKRAIVGGADSLAKFTINGFHALGILTPGFCKPFDLNRSGLNLGEGAGFLVLEGESVLANKTPLASISGFENANDAYHPSSLSPEGKGPHTSMLGALESASLKAKQIDFINTHGTGTPNNDLVESAAMIRLFDTVPPFISSKSKIGHTLGASGGIEAVFSILSILNQEIYPSLQFEVPIEETQLKPNLFTQKMPIQHIMNNSFGFGGNCSSIIFSKV